MKFRRWLPVAVLAPLAVSACGQFGEAMTAHTDVVARAAGKELKVDEAARLIASNPQIPADPQVVRALAEIWVDYVLLATAIAEDSSLASLTLESYAAPMREQLLVMKLRESVVRPDTLFSDDRLAQLWSTEGPGTEIRARHILLRAAADASPAQRDSVRRAADALRARAAAGEDFASLATQHSEDPGSASRGGDLDYFGRGRMVAQFEEAAFALQPGQISPVVESPFGYHIIKLEDRRQQQIGDQREEFRQFLVQRAVQDAEMAYLDSLSTAANVQVQPQATAIVKEIASNPNAQLRGRQAARPIVTYSGGAFTSGDFAKFARTQQPQTLGMFASATDEQLDGVVKQLAQKELLLREAERRGLTLSAEEETNLRQEMRQSVQQAVMMSGFQAQNLRGAGAIEAQVSRLIEGAVAGQVQLVPLGQLATALREQYKVEINEAALNAAVSRIESLRANQPPPAPGMPSMDGGLDHP
jgi:hypothetical protein